MKCKQQANNSHFVHIKCNGVSARVRALASLSQRISHNSIFERIKSQSSIAVSLRKIYTLEFGLWWNNKQFLYIFFAWSLSLAPYTDRISRLNFQLCCVLWCNMRILIFIFASFWISYGLFGSRGFADQVNRMGSISTEPNCWRRTWWWTKVIANQVRALLSHIHALNFLKTKTPDSGRELKRFMIRLWHPKILNRKCHNIYHSFVFGIHHSCAVKWPTIMIFDLNRAYYNRKKVTQGKVNSTSKSLTQNTFHGTRHCMSTVSSMFHVLSESESSDRCYYTAADKEKTYFLTLSPRKSHSKREAFYNYVDVRQMTTTNSIWRRLLSLLISGWIRVHPFRRFADEKRPPSAFSTWKRIENLIDSTCSDIAKMNKNVEPIAEGKNELVFLGEQSGECHLKHCLQRKLSTAFIDHTDESSVAIQHYSLLHTLCDAEIFSTNFRS